LRYVHTYIFGGNNGVFLKKHNVLVISAKNKSFYRRKYIF
jgi:hypothetical protein